MKPFSDPDSFYNSLTQRGNQVEHTASWLTINPYKGCSLKCAYCFRITWGATDRVVAEYEVEQAVEELISHSLFVPHVTPLSINVSSTDALLPKVERSTFRAIELLEQRKFRNPFGITTKLGFRDQQLQMLQRLQYVRSIVFVSLALLPTRIEPVPVEPRIRNLKLLSETKVPCVLYFRPIVTGWNDSDEKIEQVLRLGEQYCDAICIGGLRISPEIDLALSEHRVEIPDDVSRNFHRKELSKNIETRVLSKYRAMNLTVPLFKHTSCAVSSILKISNYNGLYQDPEKNCVFTCPLPQQRRCNHG